MKASASYISQKFRKEIIWNSHIESGPELIANWVVHSWPTGNDRDTIILSEAPNILSKDPLLKSLGILSIFQSYDFQFKKIYSFSFTGASTSRASPLNWIREIFGSRVLFSPYDQSDFFYLLFFNGTSACPRRESRIANWDSP